jgi:type I restriction enzyme M protein
LSKSEGARQRSGNLINCLNAAKRSERIESERFKSFGYEELTTRDKANLDLIWLKDDSLEDAANLPSPDIIAREILDDLESAMGEISAIVDALDKQLSKFQDD